MRLFTGIVFCSLVLGVTSENWFSFFKEALQGAGDLGRAYWNVLTSSHQNSKRYFYAQGNYDAAERGPGGVWAAKLISTESTSGLRTLPKKIDSLLPLSMSFPASSQSFLGWEKRRELAGGAISAALYWRTRSPMRKLRNGAGVAKTLIASDLTARLRTTELPAPLLSGNWAVSHTPLPPDRDTGSLSLVSPGTGIGHLEVFNKCLSN
ncbi:uncharacterized protein SAA4 isoform X1 [Macaca fascicularis]|uniref:uncharacterized protein SAA4 isoform X1 n=1 Tax=Macaca fascicularis TaxID=9541 RepID=UPI0032B06DB5